MGLRLLKVNFPWLGLVGLMLGVTLPKSWSLLVSRAVETGLASVTLLNPGLVIGVLLVGVSLLGVVGDTKPWMVLETRAETVTRLRSGESLCGLAEVVELPEEILEMVAVRRGFAPFSEAPGGVFMEPVGVSTPFSVTAGDMGEEGEAGKEVSDASNLEAPGSTGGRGARYLTFAGCKSGAMGCDVGEDGFAAGVPDGSGAAWDLTDLGLGVRGFGWGDPPEACGLRGTEWGCCWAESSTGRL